MAARLRTGDLVVVISGKDKGKTGKVTRLFVEEDKVIVEGINVVTRHMKPNARTPQGGIAKKEAPIHACKVMPVDPKTGKGTRVSFKVDGDATDKAARRKKVRIAVRSGEEIPHPARAE